MSFEDILDFLHPGRSHRAALRTLNPEDFCDVPHLTLYAARRA